MVAAGGRVYASDINAVINGSISRPLVVLRRSTVQSIATATLAAMLWDTEDLDTDGWHSTSSNTDRVTPTKAGWIRFTGVIGYAANTVGRRAAAVLVNGGSARYGQVQPATAANPAQATITVTLPANGTTDYFSLAAYQESGGALNTADTLSTRFEAEWLRNL